MPEPVNDALSFQNLTPDLMLSFFEEARLFPTGEYTQLNSYENRVFDVRLEPTPLSSLMIDRVILKVYRPGRWSPRAILEEHAFVEELQREGLPAPAPLPLFKNNSLLEAEGFCVALFPKIRGRLPQEFLNDDLVKVGRTLARLHNVGARTRTLQRPVFHPDHFARNDLMVLEDVVSYAVWPRYRDVVESLFEVLRDVLNPARFIRIHGDCHRGNLLHTGTEFFFVDFDDFGMGPEVQDFWMLLNGFEDNESRDLILEGYEELRTFDEAQLEWIPLLRALRMVRYATWIAQRWSDPTFPQLFPHYGTESYWWEELKMLEKCVFQDI